MNKKKTNIDEYIKKFKQNGSVIIPNILNEKECNELLHIIEKEKKKKSTETGNINSNFKRLDLFLPLEEVSVYIKLVYKKIKVFCDTFIHNARIVECSSLISYPGSYEQIWHSDTSFKSDNEAELVSFGIALEDVSKDMGPLEVFLGSNNIYKDDLDHLLKMNNIKKGEELNGHFDDGTKYQSIAALCRKLGFLHFRSVCKKGSLVIWSSKVIHRGGRNKKKERPIFYFSLLGSGIKPDGATYSLKEKYKDNLNYISSL